MCVQIWQDLKKQEMRDNITYGIDDFDEEALNKVGLTPDLIYKPVSKLSGGQQQRVALARALASKPAIIFADEPTGNLDAKSSKEVVDLLKIAQRKYHETVILVTHDQEIASIADRVITIEDGKIIQDTNHI